MREAMLMVKTNVGPMRTYACAPEEHGGGPAVLLYMDVFGLRDELFELAREFSAAGYLSLVPDLFHRLPTSSFPPVNEKHGLLPAVAIEANRVTTLTKSLADTRALVDAMQVGIDGFRAKEFATIGYCMGGRHALAAAAALPRLVRAGMSVHGGKLVKNGPASPHWLIAKLRVPFHFAFAKDDPSCPDAHKSLLRQSGHSTGSEITFSDHDAFHGWTFPTRWSHDPETAAEIRSRATRLFSAAFFSTAELVLDP